MRSETFPIIIAVIGIVWVVLNIILFFKIWLMCDNVKTIANTLVSSKEDKPHYKKKLPVSKSANNNGAECADLNLLMKFNEDCLALYHQCNSRQEFEMRVDEIIAEYNRQTGEDMSSYKKGLWEQFKMI